jgi:tRNA(Ile)-lysidine synthase
MNRSNRSNTPIADSELLSSLSARCNFPAAELFCAVSGGADSLALLALAVHARGAANVTAIHVDHGLRAGSRTEASVVRTCAEQIGARFESRVIHIVDGPNLEARARVARYEALPRDVCTGHTADDLAETMIANLLRGSGVDGLSPMLRTERPFRPLIALRRSETEAVCAQMEWMPVEDSMNVDPRFLRVRVRQEVLPLLDDVADRDVVSVLARSAQVIHADVSLLDELARQFDATDAKALQLAPEPLARRALRRWFVEHGVDPEGHPPTFAAIDRAMSVVRGDAIACEVGFGWRMSRSQQRLSLRKTVSDQD